MAKNKEPKPQKTPKEKAQESYKVHKEYKKLEKHDKLPSFIITIIVFVIFIGVFAGLYTQYDYELDFNPREQTEIDVSTPSKVLSGQIRNAFYSFFITLRNISNFAESATGVLSSNQSVSNNPEISVYLINLKTDSMVYIEENYGFFKRLYYNDKLNKYINAFGDPDYVTFQYTYIVRGAYHIDFAHEIDLIDISGVFGWDAELIHNDFVELEICHSYNGIFYGYCRHGEHFPVPVE